MGGHHNTTKACKLSSPVPQSTEYRTNLKYSRHDGFQTLDVEHRTDSRHLLDQSPGSKTETGKDGDRRRQRRR